MPMKTATGQIVPGSLWLATIEYWMQRIGRCARLLSTVRWPMVTRGAQ